MYASCRPDVYTILKKFTIQFVEGKNRKQLSLQRRRKKEVLDWVIKGLESRYKLFRELLIFLTLQLYSFVPFISYK